MNINSYQQLTDEKLVLLITRGDDKACAELYGRYSHRMLMYFFRMLNYNEEKAQDFLHDLFVKVIEKSSLFDGEKRFSTWIYSVASNMCKNEYRSREVRKILAYTDQPIDTEDEASYRVEDMLQMRQFSDCLKEELSLLNEIHREVIILRYQEELSIKEIGEIMSCSEGTIKSRIFYALKKLASCLKAFKPEP